LAYTADLTAVYAFGVVPYSRCHPDPARGGRDVLMHHLPVLFFLLATFPACVWLDGPVLTWAWMNDNIHKQSMLLNMGFGFISSLNEAIMCMQVADLPRGVWNTKLVYLFELSYKCLIFSIFPLVSSCAAARTFANLRHNDACAELGRRKWSIPTDQSHGAMHTAQIICTCIATSPGLFGTTGYPIFSALIYPAFFRRARSKLRDLIDGTASGTPPGAPLARAEADASACKSR